MTEFLLGLLLGFMVGVYFSVQAYKEDFDGEYDKAVYEWKLNKEKQNDTTKN